MFKCLECGHIFDQPRIIEESRGECFGYEAYERIGVCPCVAESMTKAKNARFAEKFTRKTRSTKACVTVVLIIIGTISIYATNSLSDIQHPYILMNCWLLCLSQVR